MYNIDEAMRLLDWAAREFEKHGVNADNWYADYQLFLHYPDKCRQQLPKTEPLDIVKPDKATFIEIRLIQNKISEIIDSINKERV